MIQHQDLPKQWVALLAMAILIPSPEHWAFLLDEHQYGHRQESEIFSERLPVLVE